MDELAPIVIFTYSRLDHLKQVIHALKNNTLAEESELYIFLDAPKKGDEELVAKVSSFLPEISGFKKVHITRRQKNNMIFNQTDGIREVLSKHKKIIIMEDDLVTNKYYLEYMNDMLKEYKDNKEIYSVCGYIPDINFSNGYEYDYFFSKRLTGWGIATWFDRGLIDAYALPYGEAYKVLLNSFFLFLKGYRISNKTFAFSLRDMFLKRRLRGDAMQLFWQTKNNQLSIFPVKSLVKNIGLDGSGVHCGVQPEYCTSSTWHNQPIKVQKNLKYDKKIDKVLLNFYNKPKSIHDVIGKTRALIVFFKDYLLYKFTGKIK